jgi:hypothetical protein
MRVVVVPAPGQPPQARHLGKRVTQPGSLDDLGAVGDTRERAADQQVAQLTVLVLVRAELMV